MKTTFLINGNKVTRKELTEFIGETRVRKLRDEVKQLNKQDPLIKEKDFFIGVGVLTVRIEQ